MSKKYAIFITALFCVFLGAFFVANAATPDRDFSPLENRTLAQAPKLTADKLVSGEFMEDFEEYVTDQFALRDQWIALKAGAEYASGKRENNGVYICDEHTLISRFDAPDQAKLERNAGYVTKLAELAEAPVTFGLIPTQAYLWADRLPAGAPNYDQPTLYADVTKSMAGKLTLADHLWSTLSAHRDEPIYYRTDHHWTSLGAYYGYAALMGDMGLEAVPLSTFTPTVASDQFYGTTFSSSGVRWLEPDTIELYVPQEAATVTNHFSQTDVREGQPLYDLSKLEGKDKYSMFLSGNKPLTVLKSNVAPQGAPRLMVIRDSFSDSLAPFLCYNFSEIHLVDPRYYKTSMAQYAKDNQMDQILVLYSTANFASESNLFVLGLAAK